MVAARAAGLRPGAEQHLVQRRGRHHPRHPRRAVGQVGLGRDRPDLRRLGRPARGADLRRRLHRRDRPVARRSSFPAGSATPTRPWRPTPRTPTSSTTTGPRTREYTFLNLADETAAHRLADPARPTSRSPTRTCAHPRLARRHPDAAEEDPGARRRRPARPGAARRVRRRRRTSSSRPAPTSTSPPRDLRDARRWRDYDTIINAAAYTAVDTAETPDGRARRLGRERHRPSPRSPAIAAENGITLVHVSSDYVFDGTLDRPYREDDPCAPLGVYGQTKAAGDAVVSDRSPPLHRAHLAGSSARARTSSGPWRPSPSAASTRTSSTTRSAGSPSPQTSPRGIRHLLDTRRRLRHLQPHRQRGEPTTWADIARHVFELTGHDPARVTGVTTDEYFASAAAAGGSTAAQQRARPRQDRGERVRHHGRGGRPSALPRPLILDAALRG